MKYYLRRDRDSRARLIDAAQRLSSAQNPLQHTGPVHVFYAGPRFDIEEAGINARRITNLQFLKEHVFGDDIARMAARAEIAPERLASILNLDVALSPELAEHLEKTLGLPGGWLDVQRESWSEKDTLEVAQHMKLASHESKHDELPAASSDQPQAAENAAPNDDKHKDDTAQTSPDLQWLKTQLDAMPRGSKSKLAALMHRGVSDLSAWINGHRPMPDFVRPSLLAALRQFDASLYEGFVQRCPSTSLQTEHTKPSSAASDEAKAAATDAPAQESGTENQHPQPRANEAVVKHRVGGGTYVSFRRSASGRDDLDAMAMRTAQTLAEVINSIMRRHEMAAKAAEQEKVA